MPLAPVLINVRPLSLALAPVSPEITKISPLLVLAMLGRSKNIPVVTSPNGTVTLPEVVFG